MNPTNTVQDQLLPALTLSTNDDPRVVREAATEDYSLHVVPPTWRLARFGLAMAWSSLMTAMFWIVVGATIALAVGTRDAVIGMVLAVIVYGAINYVLARVATDSGLTIALLSRGLLGYFGATLATLVFAAGAIYFATFEASVLAVAFQAQFGGPLDLWYLITVVYALPLVVGGVRRWLDKLNAALLPVFVVGLVGAVVWAIAKFGYSNDWLHIAPSPAAGIVGPGWLFAFSIYMGVWLIMFYTVDFARFGKPGDKAFNGLITFGPVFYSFAILANGVVGILLTATLPSTGAVSEAGVVVGVIHMMGLLGLLFVFATQTKINSANLYLASTNLESFFSRALGVRLHRWFWVVVAGLASYLFMLTDVFSFLLKALNYQAAVVVAWVAIALVEIGYRKARGEGAMEFRPGRVPAVNLPGLAAWVLASALGIVALAKWPAEAATWAPIATAVVAAALYAVLRGLSGNPTDHLHRPHDPRDEVADVWNTRIRCHHCDKSYVAVEMDRDPSSSYEPICASCAASPRFMMACWQELRPDPTRD